MDEDFEDYSPLFFYKEASLTHGSIQLRVPNLEELRDKRPQNNFGKRKEIDENFSYVNSNVNDIWMILGGHNLIEEMKKEKPVDREVSSREALSFGKIKAAFFFKIQRSQSECTSK